MREIIIAIDGPSASGKSTIAKALAAELGYAYVDSGAMYRAVTLYFLQHHIALDHTEAIQQALQDINIRFVRDERGNRTLLNGTDVEQQIRQMEVSRHVSQVAAIPQVRHEMVRQQQAMGQSRGLVMDGRDIGTVVFPNADLKIFVTADLETRARRRFAELQKKGTDATYDAVLDNLRERDRIDSSRSVGPLRQADDAHLIDNSRLAPAEQLHLALQMVAEKTGQSTP